MYCWWKDSDMPLILFCDFNFTWLHSNNKWLKSPNNDDAELDKTRTRIQLNAKTTWIQDAKTNRKVKHGCGSMWNVLRYQTLPLYPAAWASCPVVSRFAHASQHNNCSQQRRCRKAGRGLRAGIFLFWWMKPGSHVYYIVVAFINFLKVVYFAVCFLWFDTFLFAFGWLSVMPLMCVSFL